MSSEYRRQLEAWLKKLDVRADRVIDVGGSQLPVKDRVGSWDVKEYVIADLPEPHKGEKPQHVLDLNSVTNAKIAPADIVFCLEVMEYVWDAQSAGMNLRDLLKPGGMLIITFPYFYPPHEPYGSDCLRYTLNGAKKILSESGIRTKEVIHRTSISSMHELISSNALRPSANASMEEVYDSLGFIIIGEKI